MPRRWPPLALLPALSITANAAAQGAAPGPAAPAGAGDGQRVQVESRPLSDDEQRRDSLLLMTVVGRDELDRYGDTSVLDVLQRLPGISIDGEQPRLRGLGGGYTQILLNGEPAPPGFSLEQLSPSEIERIEIVKGPSAEFGGVAGTINVVLRTPPRLRQREGRATLGYRALRPVGSINLSWGDRFGTFGFQVPLAVYQWANAGDSRVQRLSRTSLLEVREEVVHGRDEWRGGGINFGPRVDWRIDDRHTLQWQVFLQRNESDNRSAQALDVLRGPPPSVLASEAASRGRWQLARTQAQWIQRWPDGARIELKAGLQGSRGESTLHYVGTPGPTLPVQRESTSDNRDSRLSTGARLRWPLVERHTLVAGGDLERRDRDELRRVVENGVEWFTGSVGRPFAARLDRAVLFAQDEWAIHPRMSALIGLRAEHLHSRATAVDGEVARRSSIVSPIAQWRWALDDKARDIVRASVARTSRVPELSTLMGRYNLNTTYDRDTPNTPLAADSAGNPDLAPERALALELATERQLPGGGVVSIGAFHRRIDGLIRRRIGLENVAEASVPRWVSRPVNFGRATSSGLELELKGRGEDLLAVLFAPRSGFNLRASLSLYRSSVEQIDDPDARLEGQPPWSAGLGFDRSLPGAVFGFGANLTVTPAFATQQTDLQRVWRSRARKLDVYALWRFSRDAQLRLALNNAAPAATRSISTVEDIDGFTASSLAWREQRAQVNASLVVRF